VELPQLLPQTAKTKAKSIYLGLGFFLFTISFSKAILLARSLERQRFGK